MPDPTPPPSGSSADWDPADQWLFRWIDRPASEVDARLRELHGADPALATQVEARLAQLRRTGWIGAGAAPAPHVGEEFGDYRILRILGTGGMGEVYLAEQRSLARRVALKVIRSDRVQLPQGRERFRREAKAVANLRHPGICAVLDFGEVDDTPYLAMQYVPGQTLAHQLSERLRNAGVSASASTPSTAREIDTLLQVVERIARALHVAHEAGIVHRDVKPANVMLDPDGQPVLLDFGLARDDGLDGSDPGLTHTDDLLGTPPYMSPEQVRPRGRAVDRRSDVYALGATLYECLTLQRPFAGVGRMELYDRIERDPTPDPRRLNPHLPQDVGAVIHKAMEKEPSRRYATAEQFADELGRIRRREPVQARRIGTLDKTWRWCRRNPVGAGLIAVLVLGLTTIATLLNRYQGKVAEFDQLSGVPRHADVAAAIPLVPAWPENIPAMERWLEDDCRQLLAMRPRIEATIHSLRRDALPWSEAEQQRDRESHARYAEWQASVTRLATLRRAHAIRTGEQTLEVPELSDEQRRWDAEKLRTFANQRVENPPGREVFGQEAEGLAAARLAVQKMQGDRALWRYLITLNLAALKNGQDEEAREAAARAAAAAPDASARAECDQVVRDTDDVLSRPQEIIDDYATTHASLEAEVALRRTWSFAPDDQATGFLHDTLLVLLDKFDHLETQKAEVEQRLAWARQIDSLTRAHPNAAVTWSEIRDAISASPRYRGLEIELRDDDVLGLVPLGMNRETGHAEFYHLRSAWDGESDPAAIPIPTFEADGSIAVTESTGIVFVLLPGGTFEMGSQNIDPDAPNFVPNPQQNENTIDGSTQTITLGPFFIARHEMTQAQWARLASDGLPPEPSGYHIGFSAVGLAARITATHPVESISWEMSDSLLTRCGLLLPTEAQWEYAARAGSTTSWFPGPAIGDLEPYENLLDLGAKRVAGFAHEPVPWDDGFVVHAPVGSFACNPFGLHDVHGNVTEWCLDWFLAYGGAVRENDGLRLQGGGRNTPGAMRVARGGYFAGDVATQSRSACRNGGYPAYRRNDMGLRAARSLHPARR